MHPDHLVEDLIDDHECARLTAQRRQLEANWRALADQLRWSEDGRQSIAAMLDVDPDDFVASRKNDSVRLLVGRNLHDGEPVAALASTATSGIGYGIRIGSEAFGLVAVTNQTQARVVLAAALGLRLVCEPIDPAESWAGFEVVPHGTVHGNWVAVHPVDSGIVHALSFNVEATDLTIHWPLPTTEEGAA